MIDSIDMGVHSNAVRTELRHYAGLNVQDCFWTYADGYRRGDNLPIITPDGPHPRLRRAVWSSDGDGTTSSFGSSRALIPATAVRYREKSDFASWAWDTYRLAPATRDWFALGCAYAVGPDGSLTFKVITNAAAGDRAGVLQREPLIVPPQAWDTWLTPSAAGGTYPPHPGALKLEALVRH